MAPAMSSKTHKRGASGYSKPRRSARTGKISTNYVDRRIIAVDGGTPTLVSITMRQILDNQATSCPDWWSEYKIDHLSLKLLYANVDTLVDSAPNADGNLPTSAAEMLRENRVRTLQYIAGKTDRVQYLGGVVPKFDVTGAGGKFETGWLDTTKLQIPHNGFVVVAEKKCTLTLQIACKVSFRGMH